MLFYGTSNQQDEITPELRRNAAVLRAISFSTSGAGAKRSAKRSDVPHGHASLSLLGEGSEATEVIQQVC